MKHFSRDDLKDVLSSSRYGEVGDIKFEEDDVIFQQSLATAWSRGPLCHDVNACLFKEDVPQMEKLSPYIYFFREAFRSANKNRGGALKPYDGHIYRYMQLRDQDLQKYKNNEIVVWPTFSSCTYDEGWLKDGFWSCVFDIRSYGAVEASQSKDGKELYLPCIIEEHVLPCYTYQKEVVIPPFCGFRVVNVNRTGKFIAQTRVFLETIQFPSVWESIETGDAAGFRKWAEMNKDLMSTTGNDLSIVNEIAKSTVTRLRHVSSSIPTGRSKKDYPQKSEGDDERALDATDKMLDVCAEMGAPLSEVDPATGANPVLTIAKAIAEIRAETGTESHKTAQTVERLTGVVTKMVKRGANITVPHEGKTVVDIIPDLAPVLMKESLLHCKWQYWVDDGVDGKSTDWYDYDEHSWKLVDDTYGQWLEDGSVFELSVKSRWEYKVNFASMTQQNTSTKKVRRIQRLVITEEEYRRASRRAAEPCITM